MGFGSAWFVIAVIAIATIGWVMTTAIRARFGYPIENEWGGMVSPGESESSGMLKAENDQLRAQVEKLEDRIKVLERIATDPSRKLSDEIENLRQD